MVAFWCGYEVVLMVILEEFEVSKRDVHFPWIWARKTVWKRKYSEIMLSLLLIEEQRVDLCWVYCGGQVVWMQRKSDKFRFAGGIAVMHKSIAVRYGKTGRSY